MTEDSLVAGELAQLQRFMQAALLLQGPLAGCRSGGPAYSALRQVEPGAVFGDLSARLFHAAVGNACRANSRR